MARTTKRTMTMTKMTRLPFIFVVDTRFEGWRGCLGKDVPSLSKLLSAVMV